MDIILLGLICIALMAILILLLKHLWLMCSKLLEAAWQAAILAMIIFPLMVITGYVDVSVERSRFPSICAQFEVLCDEPGPTLEEALIHMIEVHEANEATHRPGFQEEDATTTKPNVDPILVGADI